MVKVSVMRILRAIESEVRRTLIKSPVMLWGRLNPLQQELPAGLLHESTEPIHITINGKACEFTSGHHKSLLRFLR